MTAPAPAEGAAAARLNDPIAHSNAHARFWAKVAAGIVGGIIGGAVAVATAIIGTDGNPIKIIDTKASTTAGLTKNQKTGYPNIQQNGGIILNGPNKGQVIGSTPVDIINPTNPGNI